MDGIVKLTTHLYARELVKYVMAEHRLELNVSIPSVGDPNDVTQIFHPDVGKVTVAYAISAECRDFLVRHSKELEHLKVYVVFEAYANLIRTNHFKTHGYTPHSLFKYFAIAIEQAVYVFDQGLQEAPIIAIEMISNMMANIRDGRFVMQGGLNELNKYATRRLEKRDFPDPSESGEFLWCNDVNRRVDLVELPEIKAASEE